MLFTCIAHADVQPWAYADRAKRAEVVLNEHDADRLDTPLFVRIHTDEGLFIDQASVVVDEIMIGDVQHDIPAEAVAHASGTFTEVDFTAVGMTAAGTTRRFYIYYNTTEQAPSPVWSEAPDAQWGDVTVLDQDNDGTDDGVLLESDKLRLKRSWYEDNGRLRTDSQSGYSALERTSDGWTPVTGFVNTYQPEAGGVTYSSTEAETTVAPQHTYTRTPGQASVSFRFDGLSNPSGHWVEETYRLYKGRPWCLFTMTVHPDDGNLQLVSDSWNWRALYLDASAASFDRIVTDTRGDEAIGSTWDTDMRWLIAYDSASDKAIGWLMFTTGVIRAESSGDLLYDSYGYSAEDGNTYRYLWALDDKDELTALFQGIVQGWTVGEPESSTSSITQPAADTTFITGTAIPVAISTPSGAQQVHAFWRLPDATALIVDLHTDDSLNWTSTAPHVVDANDPEGTWELVVDCDGTVSTQAVNIAHPAHPRLLFGAAELEELRNRRFGSHSEEWNKLIDTCEYLQGHPEYPADDVSDSGGPRVYHEWMLDLALVQLIDPNQPYEERLMDFFFTMLRYEEWDFDPMWSGNDLVTCHYLFALCLTYDWHYDKLTPAERDEFRTRITDYATRAFEDISWIPADIDTAYGNALRFHNNHTWIDYAGVAAAAYVLEDEVDESTRQAWLEKIEWGYTNVIEHLLDDGSSPEGASYHTYGLASLERWIEMRRIAQGEQGAAPYNEVPWFGNTTMYTLYSILPGGSDNYGGIAMFGDVKTYHTHSPADVEPLLATRLGCSFAQWASTELDDPIEGTYHNQVWRYLWLDPSKACSSPENLPNWRHFDDQGIFVWRSSWSNDATYFSLKSGMFVEGHAHPDQGNFVLHRDGVPYIVDLGYSFRKETSEHNVLLADDCGQVGSGVKWPEPQPSNSWGSIRHVMATGQGGQPGTFFNILSMSCNAYTNPSLECWKREVVGIDGFFLLRDAMRGNQQIDYDLLLHSYVSTDDQPTYEFESRRLDNPWSVSGTRQWSIDARDEAEEPANLLVTDLSAASWNAVVEPTYFVPELIPDDAGGGYNSNEDAYQFGCTLKRSRSDASASSLLALGFDDQTAGWNLQPWEYGAEGAHIDNASGQRLYDVLWPDDLSCRNAGGWDVDGEMAGRRTANGSGNPAYFGREVTLIRVDGQQLVISSAPASVHALMEHEPTADNPNRATVTLKETATITLYCPTRPARVLLNGTVVPHTYTTAQITLTLPAGENHEIVISPDADTDDLPDFWELALAARIQQSGADSGGGAGPVDNIHPDDDLDGDGLSNFEEYIAGTDAIDANSRFVLAVVATNNTLQVEFNGLQAEGPGYEGVTRLYDLYRADNLREPIWEVIPDAVAIEGCNAPVCKTTDLGDQRAIIRGAVRLK
jgi:hypothetical protein